MPCDELCKTYDGNSKCGVERCDDNDDCTKNISCQLANNMGQPTGQTIDCKFLFQCDVTGTQSCAGISSLPDLQLCVIAAPEITNALAVGAPCEVIR
jgi:hypothetical protein